MGNRGIALLNLNQPDKAIEALQEQESILPANREQERA